MNGPIQLAGRIGVIGDPHAEDILLEKAIHSLQNAGIETLLCTGDITDGVGDIDRCCALLEENNVQTVRGNHDRWSIELESYRNPESLAGAMSMETNLLTLESRAYLMTLPKTRRFVTKQGNLLLCHGLGENDMAGLYPADSLEAMEANHALHALVGGGEYRFIINGHTHARMVRTVESTTFINAGTLRSGYLQGFLVVDFDSESVSFFNFDKSGNIQKESPAIVWTEVDSWQNEL